jgi:tetratricopeptide (TPR) repeat protein
MERGNPMRTAFFALTLALALASSHVRAHGDLHDQIDAATGQLRKHPKNAALYHRRGELERAHGSYGRALADYARAERLDPKLAVVHLSRGRALLESGKPAPATESLSRFLTDQPGNEEALLLRARAFAQLKRRAEAEHDFAALLARVADPLPDLFLERANNLGALGDRQGALAAVEDGLKRLGSLIVLEDAALRFEEALARDDQALARLNRLIVAAPRKETLLARKAHLLDRIGRPAEAAEARAEAIQALERLPPEKRKHDAMQKLAVSLRRADRGR